MKTKAQRDAEAAIGCGILLLIALGVAFAGFLAYLLFVVVNHYAG